jgi:hypothetical protein
MAANFTNDSLVFGKKRVILTQSTLIIHPAKRTLNDPSKFHVLNIFRGRLTTVQTIGISVVLGQPSSFSIGIKGLIIPIACQSNHFDNDCSSN